MNTHERSNMEPSRDFMLGGRYAAGSGDELIIWGESDDLLEVCGWGVDDEYDCCGVGMVVVLTNGDARVLVSAKFGRQGWEIAVARPNDDGVAVPTVTITCEHWHSPVARIVRPGPEWRAVVEKASSR